MGNASARVDLLRSLREKVRAIEGRSPSALHRRRACPRGWRGSTRSWGGCPRRGSWSCRGRWDRVGRGWRCGSRRTSVGRAARSPGWIRRSGCTRPRPPITACRSIGCSWSGPPRADRRRGCGRSSSCSGRGASGSWSSIRRGPGPIGRGRRGGPGRRRRGAASGSCCRIGPRGGSMRTSGCRSARARWSWPGTGAGRWGAGRRCRRGPPRRRRGERDPGEAAHRSPVPRDPPAGVPARALRLSRRRSRGPDRRGPRREPPRRADARCGQRRAALWGHGGPSACAGPRHRPGAL